jgi:hypothetical protein
MFAGMQNVWGPKLRLSVIAGIALTGPDGPVDQPSKKLAGLLAYLVCTAPRPQPREKLVMGHVQWRSTR